jgi:ATP-binding cassette, subfamily B, bacterial PglK
MNGVKKGSKKGGHLYHVRHCLRLLSKQAQFFYFVLLIAQIGIAALDLVGLAIIMQIVIGMQGSAFGVGQISSVFSSSLGGFLSSKHPETLLMYIVFVFIAKGVIAIGLHTLNVKLVARETSQLMLRLIRKISEKRTTEYKSLTIQEISYILYNATEMVFRETLVPFAIILSDTVLLALISLNLFLNVQRLFIPTVTYFMLIFLYLRLKESRVTSQAYKVQLDGEIKSRQLVLEIFSSLRELYASNKLPHFISKVSVVRNKGINAGSVISISQLRPKYFYEMALFGGLGLIAFISHSGNDQALLLTYLTFFLVSSSRAIPSLLRIQYYLGIFNKAAKQSNQIFEVLQIDAIDSSYNLSNSELTESSNLTQVFKPEIVISDVTFSYAESKDNSLIAGLSMRISAGEMVAIVGPSGAGKSTLVDLFLGYLEPASGTIKISGLNPRESFKSWPGKVSYVPQKVTIYEDSLYSNVSLESSLDADSEKLEKVNSLLNKVGLSEYVNGIPNGVHAQLSEFGSNLSGGQIQRIGIARALYSDPEIIIFDESTSSLDSTSESAIMDLVTSYKHSKTIILIAHRLSTIKNADRVIYLDAGKVKGMGTFEELRLIVRDFDNQVVHQNLDFNQNEG